MPVAQLGGCPEAGTETEGLPRARCQRQLFEAEAAGEAQGEPINENQGYR